MSWKRNLDRNTKNPIKREAFLKDNCDSCENKGVYEAIYPGGMQGHKEMLANVSIEIAEIEAEKKSRD